MKILPKKFIISSSFLLKLFLVGIFVLIQASFLTGLGAPWFNINLILILAVFLIVNFGLVDNLWLLFFGAVLLDLLSGQFFGLTTMSLLLSYFLISLSALFLLTNQSWTSLIVLGSGGISVYYFLRAVFTYFFYWLNITNNYSNIDKIFWQNLLWQIIFAIILLTIMYWINQLFFTQRYLRYEKSFLHR